MLLVLDSCRHDAVIAASPTHLASLGPIERRWSYASWTAPSHFNLLMGVMPHKNEPGRHASAVWRDDFALMTERLGVPLDLGAMAPRLWLPTFLRERGWRTGASVSLPVLNPSTAFSSGFDRYVQRPAINDLRGAIDDLRFYDDAPSFWLINTGETHYPYERPDRVHPPLPRLSGLNGTLRRLADEPVAPEWFSAERLEALRERQIDAVRYVDGLIPRLRDAVPDGTWLTVTSDHGECFGEGGFFGHGPMVHDAVFEVPFVEGRLR